MQHRQSRKRLLGLRMASAVAFVLFAASFATVAIAFWEISRGARDERLHLELVRRLEISTLVSAQIGEVARVGQSVGLSLDPATLSSLQATGEQAVAASLPVLAEQAASFVRGERDTLDIRVDLASLRGVVSQLVTENTALGGLAAMAVRAAISLVVPESLSLGEKLKGVEGLLRAIRVGVDALERLVFPLALAAASFLVLGLLAAFDAPLAAACIALFGLVTGGLLRIVPHLAPATLAPVSGFFAPGFHLWAGLFAGGALLLGTLLAVAWAMGRPRRRSAQ